ncbi:MAG: Ig-like domain-containing protein, partial [Gemmatimonadota bacterium]
MRLKDLGIVLTVAGMVACGSDGPELPIPAAIERDTTTDSQVAFAGARLARPLAVIVTDEIANVVARAEVRWTVLGGLGATVSDSVTTTDGVGRAQVDVTLGGQDGVFTIRAALVADPEKSVLFDVGALPAPRLTEVSPTTFSGGDTIIVRGVLLKDTLPVEIGGARAQLRYVSATGQAMSVVVPECLVPGPVEIRMLFPGGSTDPVMGTVDEPASQLRLSVGEYVSLDPAVVEGCATFPAAGPNGAQYVVIPQATTAVPNMTTQYRLLGDSAVTVVEATAPRAMDVPAALRFHDFLRRQEEGFARLPKPAGAVTAPVAGLVSGIEVGDRRDFRVCDKVTCSQVEDFPKITAEAKYVGDHAAIYLDINAPDTLTTAIFEEFGTLFEDDLYDVATRAFGSESDVDENGHVLILMTPVVNGLTPETDCETSIVTGFFFAIDVDPAFRNDPRSNQGEVFYALTPDPDGERGCAHSVERVRRLVPVTFIHELQHMISYNQHVLVRGGSSEVLWLNEGLSHISEELAALHFASLGDEVRFSDFVIGDLYNAYLYLENPGATFVMFSEGTGTLAERGGNWLMLRWLLDHFGEEAVTRRLVESDLTGAANLEEAS